MAAEPINIFSHKQDLAGIAAVLRQMAPQAKVAGPENGWERITVEGTKSWFRKVPVLVFKHAPDYYNGPGWPRQLAGMQGFFEQFPDSPHKPDILRLVRSFRFALATEFDPDLRLGSDDSRLKFLFAVTRHLDGVIFTPSALWDSAGRALISADGHSDAAAVLPAIPAESAPAPAAQSAEPARVAQTAKAGSAMAEPAKTEPARTEAPKPAKTKPAKIVRPKEVVEEKVASPSAARVARRALCLAAVAGRGLLELQEKLPREQAEAQRKAILTWTGELALEDELESQESALLQQAIGKLETQATTDAVWRLEGLGVLAWALSRYELPAYDQLVDAGVLLPAVGFLDLNRATGLLASPALRRPEKVRQFQDQIFAVHWRVRDFQTKKKKMNFRTFARDCWFGPLNVSLARFHDDDLAIGDLAIGNAPEEEYRKVLSSAQERHRAVNWLVDGEVYSKTDTST